MTNDASESGLELVLDNRKLIIGFVLLIFICGCFFVIGFIEGKRQGFQESSQPVAESTPKATTAESQAPVSSSPSPEAAKPAPAKEKPEEQLDWYKSVNRKEGEPEKTLQPPASSAEAMPSRKPVEKPKAKVEPPRPAQVEPSKSGPVTYTVQVGAFRKKQEVDAGAQMLKSKGFESRIEAPQNPEDLYLLKVGTFHSRAEAVAMQLKLKQSGFPCFIKTN